VGSERLVSTLMEILDLLSDGQWRKVEELLLKTGLDELKFEKVMGFLSKYNFVNFDNKNKRVKINRDFRKLLAQPAE
jgi:DNA-binding IclR family transcriptional regulator